MALKPTIYKLRIALSDLNRNYYDSLNLTLAQHPSETLERMMVRVMAYCLNSQQDLVFCKGLSDVEEPALWLRAPDEQILLWIDVGEPTIERIKKASRHAKKVKVYCFNTKADVWWEQTKNKIQQLPVSVYKFEWQSIQQLAALMKRTMDVSISISDDTVYVATDDGEIELGWVVLQGE